MEVQVWWATTGSNILFIPFFVFRFGQWSCKNMKTFAYFFIVFKFSSCLSCLANGKHCIENHTTKVTKLPKRICNEPGINSKNKTVDFNWLFFQRALEWIWTWNWKIFLSHFIFARVQSLVYLQGRRNMGCTGCTCTPIFCQVKQQNLFLQKTLYYMCTSIFLSPIK